MKTALTIAGSDPCGGAGIQADLKTFSAHGVYGMSVITALTAQNTLGVSGIQGVDPAFIEKQMEAVFSDIFPDSVKIGMVYDGAAVECIVKQLKKYQPKNIVVDPVLISTSRDVLIKEGGKEALEKLLFPLATLITPNLLEAEAFTGAAIQNKEEMEWAGKMLQEKYHCSVYIKGGHLATEADDVLITEEKCLWIPGMRIANENTHGTGCTLSSAIAAALAKGQSLEESAARSKAYVTLLIQTGLDLGKGRGPLCHSAGLQDLPPWSFFV